MHRYVKGNFWRKGGEGGALKVGRRASELALFLLQHSNLAFGYRHHMWLQLKKIFAERTIQLDTGFL